MSILSVAAAGSKTNELCFPVGERLTYRLYWGLIPVGQAEFSSAWTNVEGRTMVALTARAKTTSVVAMIYPVDDLIESIVDLNEFMPIRYRQRLKEGRHLRDDTIEFDRVSRVGRWQSGLDGRRRDIAIDADTRDVLTLAYYMRGKGLAVGEKAEFRVLVDDKVYDLELAGLLNESMKVDGVGLVPSLRIEPKARFGAIFVRRGKVMLWFSNDPRHLCVKMTGTLPLADVKAQLVRVAGAGDDFWVRIFEGPEGGAVGQRSE